MLWGLVVFEFEHCQGDVNNGALDLLFLAQPVAEDGGDDSDDSSADTDEAQ